MSDKVKQPAVRFVGHTNDWEQRKLGEIAEIVGGGTPSTSNPTYWDGDIDWYAPAEMEGQRYAVGSVRKITEQGLQNSSARVLPANRTVLFTSRAGIGKMAILKRQGATNQGFQSMVLTDDCNPYFIYSMGSVIKEKAEGVASGSTFLEISGKMLGNIEIAVPSKPEQDAIAEYFERLDDLITLHQRKYDKLVNVKKSLLDKMFPKKGAVVPEVRFAGFTDAWEQRKLGEIGVITTGSTPSTSISEYYSDDGMPWVTPTDISENVTYRTEKRLSALGQSVGRVVPKNTILVTCIASIGKNTMLGESGSFNQQINGLTPNENKYDPYFLLTESALWSAQMKRSAAAGTMQIVNRTEFSEITTWIPDKEEQEEIGSFFSKLDTLITLHQRKLEKLENIKKAFLEKIFI